MIEFSRSAPFAFSVRVDLAEPAVSGRVFEETMAGAAALHPSEVVAVGNAAMLGPVGPVERAAPAEVVAHMDTNVVSAILFASAFLAAFAEHRGAKTFVNISSGAADRGLAGWSLYCASKAAMENYVRALALEQERRPHPVRAFSVNPGVMDTAMQEEVRSARSEDFPDVEHYVRLHREGRLADPNAMAAEVVALIASHPDPGETYPLRH